MGDDGGCCGSDGGDCDDGDDGYKSTGEMPGPVSTGAMVRTLPGAFLPCVDIRGSFNVIKRTILALHWAVNAFLSLFSWAGEGRGSQEAEQ